MRQKTNLLVADMYHHRYSSQARNATTHVISALLLWLDESGHLPITECNSNASKMRCDAHAVFRRARTVP